MTESNPRMTEQTVVELAQILLDGIVPLTVAEFGVLQSAVDVIEHQRLVASGHLTAEEAAWILGISADVFAFDALVRESQ